MGAGVMKLRRCCYVTGNRTFCNACSNRCRCAPARGRRRSLGPLGTPAGQASRRISRPAEPHREQPGQEAESRDPRGDRPGAQPNPLPLLVLAGHIDADEARAALAPLFRPGAELPDEWGGWVRFDIEKVRGLLSGTSIGEDDLRAIAADVFHVQEADETLWAAVIAIPIAGNSIEGQEGAAATSLPPTRSGSTSRCSRWAT